MKQPASQPRAADLQDNTPAATEADQETRIRARAYELYVARGKTPDHEIDDWLQAEQEIRSSAEPLVRRTAA